jgi:hypothetical protein
VSAGRTPACDGGVVMNLLFAVKIVLIVGGAAVLIALILIGC